ncbi:single-stranded DNA-binding protein DdrA [Deinococcus xinjiangensis]|uniref:Single-stranded DNA-binding protein DdrA n=1 Tax=Deinococcus xinjiangensis TaxID=457454 RepID=A0ABP9V749_9DEIO
MSDPLASIQEALQRPFSQREIGWKPQAVNRSRTRALLVPYVDARTVQRRLDEICPDHWQFKVEALPECPQPAVRGTLTIFDVPREDIGEAFDASTDQLKAAASDAFKRCAVQFGIGRYLYGLPKFWVDWDDQARRPTGPYPALPAYALAPDERSAGAQHILDALGELQEHFPQDVTLQRSVYKHLKDALRVLEWPARGAS